MNSMSIPKLSFFPLFMAVVVMYYNVFSAFGWAMLIILLFLNLLNLSSMKDMDYKLGVLVVLIILTVIPVILIYYSLPAITGSIDSTRQDIKELYDPDASLIETKKEVTSESKLIPETDIIEIALPRMPFA